MLVYCRSRFCFLCALYLRGWIEGEFQILVGEEEESLREMLFDACCYFGVGLAFLWVVEFGGVVVVFGVRGLPVLSLI